MKVSVLVENNEWKEYQGEHGLSLLVEIDGKSYLFDTGKSDLFLKNMKKMGVTFNALEAIILSHGHYDHGDGLKYVEKKVDLICHPNVFVKRYRKKDDTYLGIDMSREEAAKRFNLIEKITPYYLDQKLVFLGEIPREKKETSYYLEGHRIDYILDDSALVYIENNMLNIITGCSHAGVVNIINYAKQVTNINKINTLIGGFHLKKIDEEVKALRKIFKDINGIYTGHCTSAKVIEYYKNNNINIYKLFPGLIIQI